MKTFHRSVICGLLLLISLLAATAAREIYLSSDSNCDDWTVALSPCTDASPCCVPNNSTLSITEDTTLLLTSLNAQTGFAPLSFEGPYTVTIRSATAEASIFWTVAANGSDVGENFVVEGGTWSAGLVLFLSRVTSAKIHNSELKNGSIIHLDAVSSFEVVNTSVSVLGGHFGDISISPSYTSSDSLLSNQTHILIDNSTFLCSTPRTVDACSTVIQFAEKQLSWLEDGSGASYTVDILKTHVSGYQSLSKYVQNYVLNISASYSFNSSSFEVSNGLKEPPSKRWQALSASWSTQARPVSK